MKAGCLKKCQAFECREDGSVGCDLDGDYACVTSWDHGGSRYYVCAKHRPPAEACRAIYYVGHGATDGKVVPIEAARARRVASTAGGRS